MTFINSNFALQSRSPFPHFRVDDLLDHGRADVILRWFRAGAPWRLVEEEFYEQFEFSLLTTQLGTDVAFLVSSDFVSEIEGLLASGLSDERPLILTEITAHKLVPGQTIRVHNDFIGDEETHRMLIQVNGGWDLERGGLLMLFNSSRPEHIADILVPDHNSGFGFEISPNSFHAVSTIHSGERYTLVYTFKRAT